MINPETICIHKESEPELWRLATFERKKQTMLQSMYQQKATNCGMTLDGYCQRFGINKSWEIESAGTTSGSAELGSTG